MYLPMELTPSLKFQQKKISTKQQAVATNLRSSSSDQPPFSNGVDTVAKTPAKENSSKRKLRQNSKPSLKTSEAHLLINHPPPSTPSSSPSSPPTLREHPSMLHRQHGMQQLIAQNAPDSQSGPTLQRGRLLIEINLQHN